MTHLRLLVLDAYAPEGREALRSAGGTEAGRLYERMLIGLLPDARVEIASLCRLRGEQLVDQGTFSDSAAADAWIERLEALHADPGRSDLAEELGLGRDLLDPAMRTREVANWLASLAPAENA